MSPAPKAIIISAADELYALLANDLFTSIRGLAFTTTFDLGILDVGLSDNNRKYFQSLGIKVVPAISDIDYPSREQWEAKRPGVRTLTARPFLRRYFPGYDIYIWLDADVWVQTPEAIETMIASAANSPAIHIAPELDRCYSAFFTNADIWMKFHDWYKTNFPPDIAGAMSLKPMLNAGVFAMSKESPVWDAWAQIYTEALQKTTELSDKSFMTDQLGLNILLYMRGFPCVLLPPSYNWLTFYAIPMLNRNTGMLVEPLPPHRPISQIHLTRPNKNVLEQVRCLDGTTLERRLTYKGEGT